MTSESREALKHEWITLQNNYQQSESLALVIKLLGVVVCLAGLIVNLNALVIALILAVLWLQEAIWKTFQGRTELRLLAVEEAWSDIKNESALRLYSHWTESRPTVKALFAEYMSYLFKPTVAYPYIILLPINFIAQLFQVK